MSDPIDPPAESDVEEAPEPLDCEASGTCCLSCYADLGTCCSHGERS